jgi:hypothetical protein
LGIQEEEVNGVDGMGDTRLFYVNLETIFDRPSGEKSFLDEVALDHDANPPFGYCMVSLLVVEPDYLPDSKVLCFLVVFIPHEDFTPQKYVHSSTRGSA